MTTTAPAATRVLGSATGSGASTVTFSQVGKVFPAPIAKGSAARRGGTTADSGSAARRDGATTKGEAVGPAPVLRDVSVEIAAGEVVAILGTSGCGKSTLLRIASGLERASSGSVTIDGTAVTDIDARCAFAFQEPRLLPWRTLAANVALGLPKGTASAEGHRRVDELLRLVGLEHAAAQRPREVSGGMAQRASLARALARDPHVLLLDEPFGALDALTRLKMQDLLLDIHRAAPTTVLLVTHDVDEALQLADRVILLARDERMPGSTIARIVTVPGARPRDRGSAELAALRAELLSGLGVERHAA